MRGPTPRAAYASSVFLSAVLLFDVQFVLGKHLLPWFGGAAAVWTTCMLFFQALLLVGYVYAHLLARLAPVRQRNLHCLLLGLALVLLGVRAVGWPSPLTPGDAWKPVPEASPVAQILLVLGAAVGLPYLALSATGPLLQSWYARAFPGRSPYRLYALSNLGSLLGLVGYPLVAEPLLSVPVQAGLWTLGFFAFALVTAVCAWSFARGQSAPAPGAPPEALAEIPPGLVALWFGLAAVPSVMFLAVTSQLCQELAVVPLLWMLPLALYLLSFVLCFEYGRFYHREGLLALLVVAAGVGTLALYKGTLLSAPAQVAAFSFVLLVYGLACHGELARLKPPPRRLTAFYLVIAAGGAAGGVFTGIVAPRVFASFFELHLTLLAGPVVLLLAVARDRGSWLHRGTRPLVWALRASVVVWVIALGVALATHVEDTYRGAERVVRNFYGVLRVVRHDAGSDREMVQLKHGRIIHGIQYASSDRRREATTYYGPRSGIGLALDRHPRRLAGQPLRVGGVGLGVGTIAAYARPGDTFVFYEINPEVIALSEGSAPTFTYLRESPAESAVVPGDARLALERELPRGFDVLAVDAFSSDAIPVHLLTREALRLYLGHLRAPEGVVAFHVSNRYLDLKPVVRGLAGPLGLRGALVVSRGFDGAWPSDWVLLTRGQGLLDDPDVASSATTLPLGDAGLPVWTDAHSDLLRVIKR
jgi:hypothetical protein